MEQVTDDYCEVGSACLRCCNVGRHRECAYMGGYCPGTVLAPSLLTFTFLLYCNIRVHYAFTRTEGYPGTVLAPLLLTCAWNVYVCFDCSKMLRCRMPISHNDNAHFARWNFIKNPTHRSAKIVSFHPMQKVSGAAIRIPKKMRDSGSQCTVTKSQFR